MNANNEKTLAHERLTALVRTAEADDPKAAIPIAVALAAQVLGALFSIVDSLETMANPFAHPPGQELTEDQKGAIEQVRRINQLLERRPALADYPTTLQKVGRLLEIAKEVAPQG